jgi:hypothetical protein
VDDINITLALGGSPLIALLAATTITVGWAGTLADARITSAATWNTAFNERRQWDGGTLNLVVGTARTSLLINNVDNTSDANKPVSTAQAAADTNTLNSAKTYADGLVVGLWDDRVTALLQMYFHLLEGPVQEVQFLRRYLDNICSRNSRRCCR